MFFRQTLVPLFLLFTCLFHAAAFGFEKKEGNEIIQKFDHGQINWTQGLIRAEGVATPVRNRPEDSGAHDRLFSQAVKKARQNLLDIIPQVRVDALTLVEERIQSNGNILEKIRAMVEKLQVARQKYLSDGTVTVTLELPLHGGFSQLILPEEITQLDMIKPVDVPDRVFPEPDSDESGMEADDSGKEFTGLVVNAVGFSAVPSLAPKILDEKGEQVYGAAFVSRDYAVRRGMCGYIKPLEAAVKKNRVAPNPLIVQGLRTNGPALCDIVISNADASRIRSSSKHLSFLKKCGVMIVLDRMIGEKE